MHGCGDGPGAQSRDRVFPSEHSWPCIRTTTESGGTMKKLTLDDIQDVRAYEHGRDDFRRRIIEMKRDRRIGLGPIMTLVFENTDTMLWQVQEMARAERMAHDEQIQHEIDTYNELIPGPGELSGTLLLELTSELALREWLPRLVGIEKHVKVVLADGSEVRGAPSDEDEARLTREETTAAVHFLKFRFTPDQVGMFDRLPVRIVVDHPEYPQDVALTPNSIRRSARTSPTSHRFRGRADPHPSARSRRQAARATAPGRCGLRPVPRAKPRGSQPGAGARWCRPASRSRFRSGYAGFVQPRSGLALRHGVTCLNTPGLIDAGYRDEISVLLVNHDPNQAFDIKPGDRIAQLVIQRVYDIDWDEVEMLDDTAPASAVGGRRAGGSGR